MKICFSWTFKPSLYNMSTCHLFLENMNVLIKNSQLKKFWLEKNTVWNVLLWTHYFDRKSTILACKYPKLNEIQIYIEKKWDANWWKRYWKFSHDYGVEIFFLKGHIYEKTPFHSSLVVGKLLFTNSNLELSSKRTTYGV